MSKLCVFFESMEYPRTRLFLNSITKMVQRGGWDCDVTEVGRTRGARNVEDMISTAYAQAKERSLGQLGNACFYVCYFNLITNGTPWGVFNIAIAIDRSE